MTDTAAPAPFPFTTVRTIAARDLPAFVTWCTPENGQRYLASIEIDGQWRDVFEVWTTNESREDVEAFFGAGKLADSIVSTLDAAFEETMLVVRYAVEERSTLGDLEDALKKFRAPELINVQVVVAN